MSAELGIDFERYADLMFSIANGITITEDELAKLVETKNPTATHTAPSDLLDVSNLVVFKSPAGIITIFGATQQKHGFLKIDNSYARVSAVHGPIVTANLGLPLGNGCVVRLTHEVDRNGTTGDMTRILLTKEIASQLLKELDQRIDPNTLNNWEIRITEQDVPTCYLVGNFEEVDENPGGVFIPPREAVIEVQKELLYLLGIEGFPFALTTVGATNLVKFSSAHGIVDIAFPSTMPDPGKNLVSGLPLIPASVVIGNRTLL
jgi:hypothetical protein